MSNHTVLFSYTMNYVFCHIKLITFRFHFFIEISFKINRMTLEVQHTSITAVVIERNQNKK